MDKSAHVREFFSDAEGRFLVFETEIPLLDSDDNAVSDIYAYETWTDLLSLVSRTEKGHSGSGPSSHPRIDGGGSHVVYQSEADDLVAEDDNGVSDILLYGLLTGVTERVSWGLDAQEVGEPSRNPAIGGLAPSILYDRADSEGFRQIYGVDSNWPAGPTELLSLAVDEQGLSVDNHHPGISADGRYITYLETRLPADETPGSCVVHVFEPASGEIARVACPEGLEAEDEAVPFFSEDGGFIEWRVYNRQGFTASTGEYWEPTRYTMDNPIEAVH